MVLQSNYNLAGNRLDPIYDDDHEEIHVNLANGTYPKGTVLGEVTATPGTYKAYASGNSDGSQTAKCILRYACVVASGVITLPDEVGPVVKSVPAFYRGTFKTSELTGLDATALASLQGALLSGTIADGVARFG